MATQADLKYVEWDSVDIHWEGTSQTVKCVFCRSRRGEWVPWVIVAQSALLDSIDKPGLGLYAARVFNKDDYIGRYDGEIIGTYKTRMEALNSSVCIRRVRRGHDKLITRQKKGMVELVDGVTAGPPYLHRMNDPRGTMLKPNIQLTPGGFAQVTQTRIPAFDLSKDLKGNRKSELRLSYGDEYWEIIELLGSTREYGIEVD